MRSLRESFVTRAASVSVTIASVVLISGCDWFVSAQERVERAERHVASGNDRGALIELQNAVRDEPNLASARLMLAEVSLRLGDARSAEKELELARSSGAAAADIDRIAARISLADGKHDELLARIQSEDFAVAEPARSTLEGNALRAAGRLDDAIVAFQRALQADPEWADARIGLADALIATRRSDEALRELEAVLSKDAKNAPALLMKGSLLSMGGDYRNAAVTLNEARRAAAGQLSISQYLVVLAALTEAHIASGSLPEAREVHAQLVERAPDAAVTRLLAARIAMAAQDFSTAIAESQRALAAAPGLVHARLILGGSLLAAGRLNQAEALLSELVRVSPENVEARKLLAQVNLRLQRPDVAMQVLSQSPSMERGDPQLDMLMGRANLQRGDEAAAIAVLEKSAASQPANPQVKSELAAAYLQAGQSDRAVEILQGLPVDADDARRDQLLVAALASSKGSTAALAEIDRMAAANSSDPSALRSVALLYGRYGQPQRGREILQRRLGESPKDVDALMTLAQVEWMAKDVAATRNALERALAIEPTNKPAKFGVAQALMASGEQPKAIVILEELRASDASAIDARLVLARLYLQQQKKPQADKVIEEALAASDGAVATMTAVGRIYSEAGLYEQALARYREAAESDRTNPAHLLNMARTQLALGANVSARESTDKAVALAPTSIPANALAISFDLRDGRIAAANERVAQLKKAHANDASVAILEGDVAVAAKSFTAAVAAYERASKLAPSATAALREYRARQMGRMGDPLQPLHAWLSRQPGDGAVRMVLAEAYTVQGNKQNAIAEYETLTKAVPPNAMALNNLAWLYHESNDERALATAAQAYKLAPNVGAVADTYGWILVQTGQVAEALPLLKKAVADSNSQPDIRYHYAFALARSGQQEEARRELKELVGSNAKFSAESDVKKLLQEVGG